MVSVVSVHGRGSLIDICVHVWYVCVRACVRACVHACVRACLRACVRACLLVQDLPYRPVDISYLRKFDC